MARNHGLTPQSRLFLSSRRGLFKGLRTDAAKVTVAPGPVVEDFNVIEDIGPGHVPGFIDTFSDPFFFQRTEERFCHRIIPAGHACSRPAPGYWPGRSAASRHCRIGCPDRYVR